MAHYVIRVARNAGLAALFVAAALLGILSGVLFAYAGDLPQVSALDDYAPSTITRVYAANGPLLGEFATQRRVIVGYDDINPLLRQAIIATEDAEFDRHFGVNLWRIGVAAVKDLVEWRRAQGASTLTQQLARNLKEQFGLTNEKSWERKIREIILAIQIEKRYTKREIFTIYCNQMYLGHGAYGVEAASRLYFDKSNRDLTLEEAALIAGIFQTPERQSPFVNPERAIRRRNIVLQRMADERYIDQARADQAKAKPIVTRGQPTQPPGVAPFFVEEVRQHLEGEYGAKVLYEAGLTVRTTLDSRLQQFANAAIERGLRRIDKRHGYRKPSRNVIAEGRTLEDFTLDRWARPIAEGDVVPALVLTAPKSGPAQIRIGAYLAELGPAAYRGFQDARTRRGSAAELFAVGDLIEVAVTKVDAASRSLEATLEQTPVVEAALVAIDNHTGEIRAMVGGWSFGRSKFNRAVQAFRQLGSTFKPVVYTTAIDRGFTPSSIIVDEPTTFETPGTPQPYQPQNYDHEFEGPITLRRALEDSRNIPAVKIMDALGPPSVLDTARRFGFGEDFPPYLAIALGAGDATLLEVTSAYTVFPNQGVRMKPFMIEKVLDREGNLLEEGRPEGVDAIRADTAYVMTSLLEGVIQRGTAAAAARLARTWPLAGKTGTVDDNTDAWFVGFDPDLTVGVWVGKDEKKSIGSQEQGAIAALPIWMDFMSSYIDSRAGGDPPQFQVPGNIVFLNVDERTGLPLPAGEPGITEAFIAGTQPDANSLARLPGVVAGPPPEGAKAY
ncbi:MAG: PBP1A family penicillin-binding protein [Acidobacteria bacterium]|nr:PBP1A family penicillin-binding protein [Acidobacteriota bacterium]